jgi:uncharacterized repeat protein (TIGR04076 family)
VAGEWPDTRRRRWPLARLSLVEPSEADQATDMELYDLRVVVDRIEGRSVCGLAVGDFFEVTRSSQLRIPAGGHFCLYALAAVLPLLPAKQRSLPTGDWLERESLVACPDPDERLVMRIERIGVSPLHSGDLT